MCKKRNSVKGLCMAQEAARLKLKEASRDVRLPSANKGDSL